MSEETLLTAARRAVREFNTDLNRGGVISVDLQKIMLTLEKQVHKANERHKAWHGVLANRRRAHEEADPFNELVK